MKPSEPPAAVDPAKVGTYPARVKSGGGYVWDEVLEYRVWCHPERGAPDIDDGNDYFRAFATYAEALTFAKGASGTEDPCVLIRQDEHIAEPSPGQFVHVTEVRVAEWRVEWLVLARRTAQTIPDVLRGRSS